MTKGSESAPSEIIIRTHGGEAPEYIIRSYGGEAPEYIIRSYGGEAPELPCSFNYTFIILKIGEKSTLSLNLIKLPVIYMIRGDRCGIRNNLIVLQSS